MKVYLSPQISDNKSILKINGDKVQVNDKLYDFSSLPNGTLRTLTNDVISAKRVDGELHVEIFNRLDDTATQDELFPKWQTVERDDVLDNDLTLIELDWYSDIQKEIDDAIPKTPTAEERIEQLENMILMMMMEVM